MRFDIHTDASVAARRSRLPTPGTVHWACTSQNACFASAHLCAVRARRLLHHLCALCARAAGELAHPLQGGGQARAALLRRTACSCIGMPTASARLRPAAREPAATCLCHTWRHEPAAHARPAVAACAAHPIPCACLPCKHSAHSSCQLMDGCVESRSMQDIAGRRGRCLVGYLRFTVPWRLAAVHVAYGAVKKTSW